MKIFFIASLLISLIACHEGENNKQSPGKTGTGNNLPSQIKYTSYQFDSSAYIYGCANVLLQKISKDLQYELKIELDIDSLPKLTAIDIAKYSKFIKIYLNKFTKDNKYIDVICNDAPQYPKDWKQPIAYTPVSGSLTITYWSGKEYLISAVTKNLIVQDSAKESISLPLENFEKLRVGWLGG